jgi:hypothetical protein
MDYEDRFKAIYALLRSHDYPSALRHCERKEIAKAPLAKALKALALSRSSHHEEALACANDAVRCAARDPRVLAAASTVWRRGGEASAVVAAYEAACAAAPESEALGRCLALEHARRGEWRKLQACALRLYKATARPMYVQWAACALHVTTASEVACGAGPAPLPLTGGGRGFCLEVLAGDAGRPLSLAETLLTRCLDALPPAERDSEALGLLFHTLVRTGRPAAALAALEGKYAASEGGGGGGAAAIAAPPPEDDLLEGLDEVSSEYPFADGRGGRGKVPSAFQPVDTLRYSAYLRSLVAVGGGGGGGAAAWVPPIDAFCTLLARIDSEDWAYHCGLAYCWARAAAAALEALLPPAGAGAAGAAPPLDAVEALLPPEAGEGVREGAAPGSVALVALHRSLLAPAAASLLLGAEARPVAGGVEASLSPGGTVPSAAGRGASLAALQLAAVRAELLHRASARSGGGALAGAAGRAAAAFAALLRGYVATRGNLACCFADVRVFLLPLLLPPAPPPPAPGALLSAFCGAAPQLLSMPFSPSAEVGSSSDAAPAEPLFRWSFSAAAAAQGVAEALHALRDATRPDAEFRGSLLVTLCEAKNAGEAAAAAGRAARAEAAAAAAAAAAVAAASAPPAAKAAGGEKGKGARGKRGKARAPPRLLGSSAGDEEEEEEEEEGVGGAGGAAPPPPAAGGGAGGVADPHGLQAALSPPGFLVFPPAQAAALSAARARVRRYTTAAQLLRYLRDGEGRGRAAAVEELTTAWAATLPLNAASVAAGGVKDQGEGDELLLLAVHELWDAAFVALGGGGGGVEGGAASPAARAAARAALLEAACLLAQGACASPHNRQFALAALRTAGWLGSAAGALAAWSSLRVKYTMADALAGALAPHLLRLHWPDALARTLADPLLALAADAAREVPAHVAVALAGGHASAAMDVLRLHGRIKGSAAGALAQSVKAALALSVGARKADDAAAVLRGALRGGESGGGGGAVLAAPTPAALEALRDNSDRALAQAWDPPAAGASREEAVGAWVPPPGGAAAAAGGGGGDAPLPAAFYLSWRSGSGGGAPEARLRQALLHGRLRLQHAVYSALLGALEGAAADSAAGIAGARAVLEERGFSFDGAGALLAAVGGGGGGGGGGGAPLTDCFSCALPGAVDAGLSEVRPATLHGGYGALLDVLGAAAASARGAGGGGDASDACASAAALAARGAEVFAATLIAAAAGARLAPAPADGGARVLDPRFIAELALLLHHVGTPLCVALAAAARNVAQCVGGKGGKKSPAGPASAPAATALATLCAAGDTIVGALLAAQRACADAHTALEAPPERAMVLVTGAWAPALAWAPCVAAAVTVTAAGGRAAPVAAPPAPLPADLPQGPGAAWVEDLEVQRTRALRRAVHEALQVRPLTLVFCAALPTPT